MNRVAAVNRRLKEQGDAERLRAGRGFYFFSGGSASRWPDSAVFVGHSTDLSVEDWLREFRRLRAAGSETVQP